MDTSNPVVALCAEGIQAEGEGRNDDALGLFIQAWDKRTDDYDACVAAHYVARHQSTPEDSLRWNQEALTRADAVADDSAQDFYPSLCLNLGWSLENLGRRDDARAYYELAAARLGDLPPGPYRDTLRDGIDRANRRILSSWTSSKARRSAG